MKYNPKYKVSIYYTHKYN